MRGVVGCRNVVYKAGVCGVVVYGVAVCAVVVCGAVLAFVVNIFQSPSTILIRCVQALYGDGLLVLGSCTGTDPWSFVLGPVLHEQPVHNLLHITTEGMHPCIACLHTFAAYYISRRGGIYLCTACMKTRLKGPCLFELQQNVYEGSLHGLMSYVNVSCNAHLFYTTFTVAEVTVVAMPFFMNPNFNDIIWLLIVLTLEAA